MGVHYKTIILLFCGIWALDSHAIQTLPDSAEYKKIMQLHEETRKMYAPDARTAIFEVYKPDEDSSEVVHIKTTDAKAKEHFLALLHKNNIPSSKTAIFLLPDSIMEGYAGGIVNLSVANLRTAPRNQAELATQVLLGTALDLLEEKNNHYRVRTPEGYIAWVSASSVVPVAESGLLKWKTAKKAIFIDDYGHAYTAPDAEAMRVSDLVKGNILTTNGYTEGYLNVTYPDGREAYVKANQALPFDEWLDSRDLSAQNILNDAKKMMGLPYLWGGTSVKGVDCSGFTKTAYYSNGLIIPRDASQQVLAGLPVDILTDGEPDSIKILQNLQPADLLFFAANKRKDANARITHVALYIGNGEFIHASGTVRINSLLSDALNFDDYQAGTLVAARRYIGQQDDALKAIAQHPAYTVQR